MAPTSLSVRKPAACVSRRLDRRVWWVGGRQREKPPGSWGLFCGGRRSGLTRQQASYKINVMERKNWRQVKAAIGNLFLDMGKLSFGGLMLGSVLRGGLDPFQTFLFGGAVAVIFFAIGIAIIAKIKE